MGGGTGASVRALADDVRSGRWADLWVRTASALVLAPLAVGCIWAGGWAWAALMAVAAIGLGAEWARLCGVGRGRVRPGWLALGVPYLGVPLLALWWLRAGAFGRAEVLVLFPVVWASDIGAYVAGRAVGGKRLAPTISPGKTWSGAVGGLVAAAVVGAALVVGTGLGGMAAGGAAGAVLGVAAQAGDLFESWAKRQFGVKDSGSTIPGHGGLLDRLDGVLGAAPVAAAMVWALGRGGGAWH